MSDSQSQPKYLSQGVDYLGFLKQQLGDLLGIHILAHELIQNADDVQDDAGNLVTTRISFDITRDALLVENDAVFRDIDFERLRTVAGGTKRSGSRAHTTGTFGVGFISVYQVTDRPEIFSSGKHWILRPEEKEHLRVEEHAHGCYTCDRCALPIDYTLVRLPWASQDSVIREKLGVSPVTDQKIDTFTDILRVSLPRAALFLKKLDTIELLRDGKVVIRITRQVAGGRISVDYDGTRHLWQLFEGTLTADAKRLKAQYASYIEPNRYEKVQVAIPESPGRDGLLFATLPTEDSTGLPFHINADFFPDSDRKSIVFGEKDDHRSEWNRAAIRASAAALRNNLPNLLKFFENQPAALWSLLERLQQINQEYERNTKRPLGVFWEAIADSLSDAPVAFTESGHWLIPSSVRIPTGEAEERSAHLFNILGIELVHRDLWRYRNILNGASVGVRFVKAEDIHEALAQRNMVDQPQPLTSLPQEIQSQDAIRVLWDGVNGILKNARGKSERDDAYRLFRKCSLAPGMDGRLWPCHSAYRSDEKSRKIFSSLLAHVSFLAKEGIPLFDELCPPFLARSAIKEMDRLDSDAWNKRDFDPVALLGWFDNKKAELTEDERLRELLASKPVFPSGSTLKPLEELWLPGGFEDPLGVTDLVDMSRLRGLSDFLSLLGARELTFKDYARRYAPKAFGEGSTATLETKRQLIDLLAEHIGQIRDHQTKSMLTETRVIECTDDKFRQPRQVYLPTQEVKEIFDNLVPYARLPDEGGKVAELYKWIGVSDHPRPEHVIEITQHFTSNSKPPQGRYRDVIVRIIDSLGKAWGGMADSARNRYGPLRSLKWLPAEGDRECWHHPAKLYATYNKSWFESQAKFLDVPFASQRRDLLKFLGVNLHPKPFQVIQHLIKCSAYDVDPPKGIYQWLNDNASEAELQQLKGQACLRLGNSYVRPDQVFWGQHPFSRFRVEISPALKKYSNLLTALEIKAHPNHVDAINVLKDVSRNVGSTPLTYEDQSVVAHCWVMLSDALRDELVSEADIAQDLANLKCIPNRKKLLYQPNWMFFEDRPGLAEKFDLAIDNTITRPEGAWQAMATAGVRPISLAVQGELLEVVNPKEEPKIQAAIADRSLLIRRIIDNINDGAPAAEESIPLANLRFFQADDLRVVWRLRAFNREQSSAPEPTAAYLDRDEATIYYKVENHRIPWLSVARELVQAVSPGPNVVPISLGFKTILEANDRLEAELQLDDVGMARIESTPKVTSSNGQVIQAFTEGGEASESKSLATDEDLIDTPAGEAGVNDTIVEPSNGQAPLEVAGEFVPFTQKLFEMQTADPAAAAPEYGLLPESGPMTKLSADQDTRLSTKFGRRGGQMQRSVTRWTPTRPSRELEEKFKTMVHADYGKRCQICSRTFKTRSGEPQVFVISIVPPSADFRTNHFGNLVGACAWHAELLQHGQWSWLRKGSRQPIKDWQSLAEVILSAPEEEGESGKFKSIAVRFFNVYLEGGPDPVTVDEEIRYSLPHWKYLRSLLIGEEEGG